MEIERERSEKRRDGEVVGETEEGERRDGEGREFFLFCSSSIQRRSC